MHILFCQTAVRLSCTFQLHNASYHVAQIFFSPVHLNGFLNYNSTIVQFRIRHDCWIKALTTHLCRVSLDLKKIFINTDGKVPQIWKLNNTQSCKQVIFSLEFVRIFYFRSRLTLYKCVISAFIQRSWRIGNWTIVAVFALSLPFIAQNISYLRRRSIRDNTNITNGGNVRI